MIRESSKEAPGIVKTLKLLVQVGIEKRTLFFYLYYIWSGVELAYAHPNSACVSPNADGFCTAQFRVESGSKVLAREYRTMGFCCVRRRSFYWLDVSGAIVRCPWMETDCNYQLGASHDATRDFAFDRLGHPRKVNVAHFLLRFLLWRL